VASPEINDAAKMLEEQQKKLRQPEREAPTADDEGRFVVEGHERCIELENEFVAVARANQGVG